MAVVLKGAFKQSVSVDKQSLSLGSLSIDGGNQSAHLHFRRHNAHTVTTSGLKSGQRRQRKSDQHTVLNPVTSLSTHAQSGLLEELFVFAASKSLNPLKAVQCASWDNVCIVTAWDALPAESPAYLRSVTMWHSWVEVFEPCYEFSCFICSGKASQLMFLCVCVCGSFMLHPFFIFHVMKPLVIKHFIMPSNHRQHCPVFSFNWHFTKFPSIDFHVSSSPTT